MILAQIINKPNYKMVHIEGHAQHSDGPDIVCAAVSGLAYAFMEYCAQKDINLTQFDVMNGFVHMITTDDNTTEAVELLRCGMECIERQYPECVRMGDKP